MITRGDPYQLKFTPSCLRDLKRLKNNRQVLASVLATIEKLAHEPRPFGVEHLGGDAFRVRDGEYRIVYCIDDSERIVAVTRIRHRKDVYRH